MALFVPKDRRSLFRQFLGGMYDAVVITDPNGHILDINARATEHFGRDLEEALDQPISRLIPGLQPEVVQRIRKGIEGDRHVMINANGQTKDGEKFACEVTVSVIDLMNPGDLVFTIRNIEKRRAMMTLYRSKENAFDLSPSPLFVADEKGALVAANASFLSAFHLSDLAQAQGKSVADLFQDDAARDAFQKALAGARVSVPLASLGKTLLIAPNAVGRKTVGVVGALTGEK